MDNVYWDEAYINTLDYQKVDEVVIGRIDKKNKILYKEHQAIVYNNGDIPPKPKKGIIYNIFNINKNHNVMVYIKSNTQKMNDDNSYYPSIGLSAKGEEGYPCYQLAEEGYSVIIKLTLYHKKGIYVCILKSPIQKFKESEYSNKSFNDYNGRVDYHTDKKSMLKIRHDYQKFLPLEEFYFLYGEFIEGEEFEVNLQKCFKDDI